MKYSLFMLVWWLGHLAQLPYDATKVTAAKEINLTTSAYRGIEDRGTVYYVGEDAHILTAYAKDGNVKWQLDVSKVVTGKVSGTPGIRYICLKGDEINVTYAKHSFVAVNIATGEGRYLGSD